MFSGNAPRYYVSRGAGFGKSLTRDCSGPRSCRRTGARRTPTRTGNGCGPCIATGSSWHALVHNEFHDAIATKCQPGNPAPGNPCWYNSVTYAVFDGRSAIVLQARRTRARGRTRALCVGATRTWRATRRQWLRRGLFRPEQHRAGKGRLLLLLPDGDPNQELEPRCRAVRHREPRTLGDPASWRAWDGSGFNLHMTSPYVTGHAAPVCASLGGFVIPSHLVYDTYLERYMAVASSPGPLDVNGRPTCGFFYALSADLIHWSTHRLLVEASLGWCAADPAQPGVLEPVLVDVSVYRRPCGHDREFRECGAHALLLLRTRQRGQP